MAESIRFFMFLCICALYLLSLEASSSSTSSSMCPRQSEMLFLETLHPQCPLSCFHSPPMEVDGNILDKTLILKSRNAYTSVLFYASWCPFSQNARLLFEALSSMFPQIEHMTIEQSSAMPSVFSRYGIHSLPAILVVNGTSKIHFHGSKDLQSLVKFYKKTTGLKPVQCIDVDQPVSLGDHGPSIIQLWHGRSLNEILTKEPYVIFAIAFLCLRVLLILFPKILSCFKAFWVSYRPHMSLQIFGEAKQISGRVLQMIDLKKVRTKLGLCKARRFHQGAKNARVWASSLASVSLGETSSSKSSS